MVDLPLFSSGETGYIAKLNSNQSTIVATLNTLLSIVGSGSGGGGIDPSLAVFLTTLFENTPALIGVNSYKPTGADFTLTVAAGGAFRATTRSFVQSIASVPLSFSGQPAATYYIAPDVLGSPVFSTDPTNGLYSVVWSGFAFGTITKLVKAFPSVTEEDNARISTTDSIVFPSLDARLEAIEAEINTVLGTVAVINRKVGLSLDNSGQVLTTGVKGSIQVDFNGTIIGWMAIADQPGTISVDVDLHRTSPPSAPPTAPPIPNTTTDKISASAPIAISVSSPPSQSQSAAAADVSTWATTVLKWDVIQFNVTAVSLITRLSLYILIRPS